jgi:homogentisate 1,2-dioxygenase
VLFRSLARMFQAAKPATDEVAVMMDTRDALEMGEAAQKVEWAGYVESWQGSAEAKPAEVPA